MRTTEREAQRSGGQILVLLVVSIFVVMGFVAVVIDISWYWASSLRIQRAADAAALSGVVYLPGDVPAAVSAAKAEASTNGYTDGSAGVAVSPIQDAQNDRRLDVTVSAPVGTFFMKMVGISSIPAVRTAKAEYILSVPMGSPLNYYGIDQLTKAAGATTAVPQAKGSGTLSPQGFWGAIITKGGNRQNGDAYSPLADDITGTGNPNYDANGYSYEIVVPAKNTAVRVYLFDPAFCGVGANPTGGYYGTGDHWIGTVGTPVSTYYDLYNENSTPLDPSDDTLVTSTGTLFENQVQTDQSMSATTYVYGTPQMTAGATDCAASPYHNQWYLLAKNIGTGSFRLQVHTTNVNNATINASTNAENMFGVEVTSNGTGAPPQVHGEGRMAAYNNLVAGVQTFYLAQIDRVHAGKSVEIDLFDPGDVSGDAFLRILSPDGNVYGYASFNYSADAQCTSSCSGTGVTQIQTHYASGSSPFNDSWIRITVALPPTYGSVGLTPPGETSAGWWKIQYTVAGGNDTTTWRAYIIGNPVHLVVP